jgi:hypothetical protein
LSVLALGFAQALYALDAADGQAEPASDVLFLSPERSRMNWLIKRQVVNVLIQGLLQYVSRFIKKDHLSR